jgi:lipopolysaccharide export system permease protein
MKVITWYIVKEILKGSLLALIILLTLFNLFTFADELKDIGKQHYGLKEIVYYVALTSPTVVYELVPAAGLIGSLFVLGSMGNNRELIAMKAAGLSMQGIVKSVLVAGMFLVSGALLTGEFIAPTAERLGQKIRATALNEKFISDAKYGLWFREGDSFINVREIRDDGKLENISIYEVGQDRHLRRTIHADSANFVSKGNWKLINVRESQLSTEAIQISREPERLWRSSIAPDLVKIVVVNPNNLSLYDLAQYIEFLNSNHQKAHSYEVAFWGRALSPLTTFIMLMVSAPFVIGIRRGVSVGARILVGVTIGMSFNIVDKLINHFGIIYSFNPLFMALLPNLLVAAILLAVMYRAKST